MHSFIILALLSLFVLTGCSTKTPIPDETPNAVETISTAQSFDILSHTENFDELLVLFRQNCEASMSKKVYPEACAKAHLAKNAKAFFETNFELKRVEPNSQRSLLTGYYEPLLYGSVKKTERFKYPVYAKPKDLVTSDKKVRGRSVKGKIVPYFTREEISKRTLNAEILCYVDDRIDLFSWKFKALDVSNSKMEECCLSAIAIVTAMRTNPLVERCSIEASSLRSKRFHYNRLRRGSLPIPTKSMKCSIPIQVMSFSARWNKGQREV